MFILFILLSLLFYGIALKIWRSWLLFSGLKVELIALTLGLVAFNVTLGLILLFDSIEGSPDNLFQQFTHDGSALSTISFCLLNALFYTVFTILFLTRSVSRNHQI